MSCLVFSSLCEGAVASSFLRVYVCACEAALARHLARRALPRMSMCARRNKQPGGWGRGGGVTMLYMYVYSPYVVRAQGRFEAPFFVDDESRLCTRYFDTSCAFRAVRPPCLLLGGSPSWPSLAAVFVGSRVQEYIFIYICVCM